jgi:hypothetical protein
MDCQQVVRLYLLNVSVCEHIQTLSLLWCRELTPEVCPNILGTLCIGNVGVCTSAVNDISRLLDD